MIVIPDFKLLVLVAKRVKTSHIFRPRITKDGFLADPKMRADTEHKVYQKAPFGSKGSKYEPPMFIVQVHNIFYLNGYEITDEHVITEGFASLEVYRLWWNAWRAGSGKNKLWEEMQNERFWVCDFTVKEATHAFIIRLQEFVAGRRGRRPK